MKNGVVGVKTGKEKEFVKKASSSYFEEVEEAGGKGRNILERGAGKTHTHSNLCPLAKPYPKEEVVGKRRKSPSHSPLFGTASQSTKNLFIQTYPACNKKLEQQCRAEQADWSRSETHFRAPVSSARVPPPPPPRLDFRACCIIPSLQHILGEHLCASACDMQ